MLEEIFYFAISDETDEDEDDFLSENSKEEILKKPSVALLLKRSSENLPNAIDEVIAQMIYGNLRKPPGDEKCPFQKLLGFSDGEKSIWIPLNSCSKAMALKWLFPNVSGPFRFPIDEKPTPPHVLVAYDAFKSKEITDLMTQFPGQVLKYGFFSNHRLGQAALIAKTVEKFESKTIPTTYEEQMILQLSKSNNECFTSFMDMGPTYASIDAVEGEAECKIFFPADYAIPEEIIEEIKKKPKKKSKFKLAVAADQDAVQNDVEATSSRIATETNNNADDADNVDEELEQCSAVNEDEEEEIDTVAVSEADKATSPMEQ